MQFHIMLEALCNPTRVVSGVQTGVGGAVRLTSSRNSHHFKSWRENWHNEHVRTTEKAKRVQTLG